MESLDASHDAAMASPASEAPVARSLVASDGSHPAQSLPTDPLQTDVIGPTISHPSTAALDNAVHGSHLPGVGASYTSSSLPHPSTTFSGQNFAAHGESFGVTLSSGPSGHDYLNPLPTTTTTTAAAPSLLSPPSNSCATQLISQSNVFIPPAVSSPLSSAVSLAADDDLEEEARSPAQDDGASAQTRSRASSVSTELAPLDCSFDFEYDGTDSHRILRIMPTVEQWNDFPAILAFARSRGANDDGCFKINLPEELQEPLPPKGAEKVPANAFKPKELKKNSFWRVNTVASEGTFASSVPGPECTASASQAIDNLRKLFRKNNNKQLRNVRYRVDVPAWTADQRRAAGVPERSPIYPLKGDKLDDTLAIIPGIHTPYVYESGPHFGASFQIHAEDFRLVSLNHLYKGRKIWIVVPSTAVDVAEEALGRKNKCSQFMRHRAEFFFPQKLEKLGIPFRIVDQRPGETIVILPDAYHEGFSTGYTIAEAKNYADPDWTTETYQPCEASCQLVTAIPAELMRPLKESEERLDLCAGFEELLQDSPPQPSPKRPLENNFQQHEQNAKRIKV